MSTSIALRSVRRSPAACEPDALSRALGDPTRVRIANLLAAGELCVCDLVELLALPQPTVSRHLAVLRTSGIVRARRRGRYVHYRLAEPGSAFHAALLRAIRRDLDEPGLAGERSRALECVAERRRNPC
ncbi:MAG: ArsR/SmtB family transcription factor [Gemmatimonadota bacterium]